MTTLPMTDSMRKEIVERVSGIVARASAPKALLSLSDLEALTGFDKRGRTIYDMVKSRDFPRPVMVSSREKRWFSSEVFRWLEARRL